MRLHKLQVCACQSFRGCASPQRVKFSAALTPCAGAGLCDVAECCETRMFDVMPAPATPTMTTATTLTLGRGRVGQVCCGL
jgi:hypothetical protein